ncbi:MAG: PP0621 family protein [Thiovulaceae bacterium]|jgi:uncharacterized protein|nr:PP0621 family protein [Sulfurimonadaceae bacterium]MDD3816685.1 PP0621 family protein [Sulfurimonadaceae bacterium]
MLLKILLLVGVVALVYFIFFKKKPLTNSSQNGDDTGDEMVACHTCGTYVTLEDALLSNGKYYCSQECLVQQK